MVKLALLSGAVPESNPLNLLQFPIKPSTGLCNNITALSSFCLLSVRH